MTATAGNVGDGSHALRAMPSFVWTEQNQYPTDEAQENAKAKPGIWAPARSAYEIADESPDYQPPN